MRQAFRHSIQMTQVHQVMLKTMKPSVTTCLNDLFFEYYLRLNSKTFRHRIYCHHQLGEHKGLNFGKILNVYFLGWRLRCCLELDICFWSALLKGLSIQHVRSHDIASRCMVFWWIFLKKKLGFESPNLFIRSHWYFKKKRIVRKILKIRRNSKKYFRPI